MNSTYDYDPGSRKDELINIVANVLNIIAPVLRPDVAVMVGAFPWGESISLAVSCLITRRADRVKYSIFRLGSPACHSRMTWLSHASIRSSISNSPLITLFKKR